jgi:hypothetical protein
MWRYTEARNNVLARRFTPIIEASAPQPQPQPLPEVG